jgi:hypothetical protein
MRDLLFRLAICVGLTHASIAWAQEITGLKIEPSEISVGKPIDIFLDVKFPSNSKQCAVLLNFGDGNTQSVRIEEDRAPVKITYQYQSTGNYAVTAEGKTQFRGLKTTFACQGTARSAAISVRQEDYAAREAAERAAEKAALERAEADRQVAMEAAKRAAADREAAQRTAQKAALDRAAFEKEKDRIATERAMLDKAARDKAMADKPAADQTAAAQRAAAAQTTSPQKQEAQEKGNTSPQPAPAKAAPVKARSSMDL